MVANMKSILSVFIMSVILTGCFSKSIKWDGSFNQLPEIGKNCAVSWVGNIYTIEGVEAEIVKLGFAPENILLLKSASSDQSTYLFAAIFEADGEILTIVGNPKYKYPIVKKQNGIKIVKLLSKAQGLERFEDSIIKGNDTYLSHTPCDFIYYKSGTAVHQFAVIGLFETDPQDELLSILAAIKDNIYDDQNVIASYAQPMIVPTASRLDILRERIRTNIFFEVDRFDD